MYKCRCSQIGQIMTNDRTGKGVGKTVYSHIYEVLKSEIYGRVKVIDTKEIRKGIAMEDDAIDKAIEWLDIPFVLKNETNFNNEWLTGTPDLILEDEIIDIKCSWDWSTFPLFDNELPNKDYYWQMQGYMALTGKNNARVVYILNNTPAELNYGNEDNYDHIESKYRIKVFSVARNEDAIKSIYDRVEQIRIIYNQLKGGAK